MQTFLLILFEKIDYELAYIFLGVEENNQFFNRADGALKKMVNEKH